MLLASEPWMVYDFLLSGMTFKIPEGKYLASIISSVCSTVGWRAKICFALGAVLCVVCSASLCSCFLHCPQLCRARDPGWEESRTPTLYVTLPIQFAPRYLCSSLHDQTRAKPWSVFICFAEWSIAGFWAWVFSQIGQAVSVPTFLCLLFDAKYVFISCLDHLGISMRNSQIFSRHNIWCRKE